MANISITAANVLASSLSRYRTEFKAGATITQGQAVYLDTATNTWKLADANPTGAGQAVTDIVGIALVAASSGQPMVVAVLDTTGINLGATLVVGTTYVVSATAGAICPIADLVSTDFPILLGTASTAALLILQPSASGVAKA